MLSYKDVQELLRIPLIGVIPESDDVLQASNQGTPAIHLKDSDVATAYLDVVARFLDEDRPAALRRLRKARPAEAPLRRQVRCRSFPTFSASKQKTASVAKERLSLIIAHERGTNRTPDFLPDLQRELIAVISKYVNVGPDDIKVQLEKQDNCEILEVNITLPEQPQKLNPSPPGW
jgi:cell division topological specificity factor MinE